MEPGIKGPPLRLETLAAYLDEKLEHEGQVLDLLIVAQARGQTHQELWDKLHSAALRDDRLTELAFAYEKLGQDRRVRIMPPPNQAQIFVNAARFFIRALGDLDGAQQALERVLALVPGHAEAFEQLRRILEDKGDKEKLIGLHLAAVGPKTDKESALAHYRPALNLAVIAGDTAQAAKIGLLILKLDGSDQGALDAISTSLEAANKYPELVRVLEQAVGTDPPPDEEKRLALRVRLLELYDDKVPEIERAAPHVEEVLAQDPHNPIARRVANRLLSNKAVAARAAGALEKVFEAEGDRTGVGQMLQLQIEQLRGPKKAEAQRRLGMILFEQGDEPAALSNFEAVLGIDPSDDDVRARYVELARKLGKQADASRILSRAAAAVKSPQGRARINLDAARFLAELGDPKRARVILQGVIEQGDPDVVLDAARVMRGLGLEPKALAPALEEIAKNTASDEERLAVLRELAALYEKSLDDLTSAIQARKRVLELDPTAEPEELERLLEARKDWVTLAEVLEIRARSMPAGEALRRDLLLRAGGLKAEEVQDAEGATTVLTALRAEYGSARDIHALLIPLLDAAGNHTALIDVITAEIDLAEEEERPALITRLAESLLAVGKVEDTLDALQEVVAVQPDQPRARERLSELQRGWAPPEGVQAPEGAESAVRLRAARILAPLFRNEEDATGLVGVLEVIADLDADPNERLTALAEAHERVDTIGKDRVKGLFLAGRGLREAVAHDLERLPDWLERIGRSENGPSKAVVAETLASALRDRTVDHPNLARLAQKAGEAYAAAADLSKAIETFRRVLEFEPDNEEMIERIDHLLAQKGSPDERITLYRASLERPGTDARKRGLYLAIGGVQAEFLNALDDAIATYRGALEVLPGDRALRDALLEALEAAKRHGELYDELLVDRGTGEADVETAALDLRLASIAVLQSDATSAVRHYREAFAVEQLGVEADVLDHAEELAKAQVDVALLVAVAERRVKIAAAGEARVTMLEHLGALVGDRGGDPARAAQCFLQAAEEALETGDRARAASDFERVVAYQPDSRPALERLLEIHAKNQDRRALLDVGGRLLALVEEAPEALALVEQLTQSVITEQRGNDDAIRDLSALVSSVEGRFGKSMATVGANARILLSAGRLIDAATTIAEMLSVEGERDEAAEALTALLEANATDETLWPTRRALLEYGVARARLANDDEGVRDRRLELLRFERDVAKDPQRAAAVLDGMLAADPQDDDALVARHLLAIAEGDFKTAEQCLERRLEIAGDDDGRALRGIELARLRLRELHEPGRALEAIEPLIITHPNDPALPEIALAALAVPEHAERAAKLLVRIADAEDNPNLKADIYQALFDVAEGVSDGSAPASMAIPGVSARDPAALLGDEVAPLYRAWLETLANDPVAALAVAARAAKARPADDEFWDRGEELARQTKQPEPVAKAYRAVLAAAKGLVEDVILQVGDRGVAFHEEWFDDQEQVTAMLRQVVEAAPSATSAFERLKLVYNALERWTELFDLYDRVIAAQPAEDSRALILEDAVEVARDLAGDSERAITYLEQLRAMRPRDNRIESQLERLYERQNKPESLIGLLTARLERLDGDEARSTRFRIATLWESVDHDRVRALEAIQPLVEAGDADALAMVERWIEESVPTPAAGAPRGSYRALARSTPNVDPMRAPGARLLQRLYAARGDEEQAVSMIEILLEAELEPADRLKWIRTLAERKSQLGDVKGALEATLAEVVFATNEADETSAADAAMVAAAGDDELMGRVVDALCEIGESEPDRMRSLRLLRRSSELAREELKDESRSITSDLAILSRSDEDPAAARGAARKLDKDLKAAGREVERCIVLERLAILEDRPEARRAALLEAARVAQEASNDRPRAIRNLQNWLDEVPTDVEVLSLLIDNLRATRDDKALVRALDSRAQFTKQKGEAESDRIEIARLLANSLQDRPAAVDAYKNAIERHGASDELADELADVLEADGREAELGDLLRAEEKRAGKDTARRSSLLARLGETERRRGHLDQALDAFASALDLVPSSPKAQSGLETLIGGLSPQDDDTKQVFAGGVMALGASFERANQMDRWLALVPARMLALSSETDKCELLMRAASLEEEISQNDQRALERTAQAFTLRPEFIAVAPALLERARKTNRWDIVAPILLPPLASRTDIAPLIARDLLVEAAAWVTANPRLKDSPGLVEALLSAAHTRVPRDEDVLERLVAHRRDNPGPLLVEGLLALSDLRGAKITDRPSGDLELLREALTVSLREVGNEAQAVPIAVKITEVAGAQLEASGGDANAEDALAWSLDILDPIWSESKETAQLKAAYLSAAQLPVAPARARAYLVLAARLAEPEEAAALYERLFGADPNDFGVANDLAALYESLDRKPDLARLFGRMAESAVSAEERATLRLKQAQILIELRTNDAAISVLKQSIAELATHESTVALLATLLEEKKANSELCALLESQADLARKTEPRRALGFYVRAAELADTQLKDVHRAARAYRRVVDIDPSRDALDRFASLLERARQFDEEAQVLERLVQDHGREDEISLRLAAAYGNAGKVERAREELERAVAGGGGSPRIREVLASIYRAAGAWSALAELFETEAQEATNDELKVTRLREAAQVYVDHLQQPEAAVGLLERAALLKPEDLDSAMVLAAALRAAARLDEAREQLAKLLAGFGTRKPKERALVHFELAKVAIAAKDRTLALTELDNAAKIDPAHAGVLRMLGEIALEEGQFLRAQRTYRGLLLVLRAQRADRGNASADALLGSVPVFKSQVFVELAFIAERQKDADRKAEFVESAFEAARESAAERGALLTALERRGYPELVARALAEQLEVADLAASDRDDLELRLAELYGKKLERAKEATDLALGVFVRGLETEGGTAPTSAEPRVAALLGALGKLDLLYDALRLRSESDIEERASLLLRAAAVAETYLKDDARSAESLEDVLDAWSEAGGDSAEERARVLARLDPILSRMVASGTTPSERLARVLEQTIDLMNSEGGSFNDTLEPFYRLLTIHLNAASAEGAYALLERAVREDGDGERLEEALRRGIAQCASDTRFPRLLEDFGRERGRGRAVVDALEIQADRAADPSVHLKEAFEASVELEDPDLSIRLLRRLVPTDAAADTTESAWALVELAERRFAASDAREAADLWERAARVSDPGEERALELRVADLAHRVLGQTDRAVTLYERLRKREPADREFWSPLAEIYSAKGDTEALAQLMDETIPLVDDLPERAKLRLSLAKLLEVTDPDRAADVLGEAIDEDPTNQDAAALLERLYEATGRDDKLTQLLDRQLDNAKDEDKKDRVVGLSLRIGYLRERLNEHDAALDAYHGALDWDPNNLSALRAAVRLHGEREDSIVMSDLLDRLLELEQGDEAVTIALRVADLRLSTGDPSGAEKALAVGFKNNPRSAELKQRLMALYTERGDRPGLARVAAAEGRSLPDAKGRRAILLESAETIKNEGDQREAADLYGEILESDPTDRDTLFYFMETCANTAQHGRAILAVDKALTLDEGDPWLLFSRAVLREAVGESDSALDDLEAAFDKSGGQYANELRAHLEAALLRIGRDPAASRRSEASIRLRLAEVAAQGGDVDAARNVVEELLQSTPTDPSALAALAKIEELSGQGERAVAIYGQAVDYASGPTLTSIAGRMFDAARRINRLDAARSGVEKAVAAAPEDAGLRASLRAVYEETGALFELADLIVEESRRADSSDVQFSKLIEAGRLLLYGNGESSIGPAMAERAYALLESARALRPNDQDLLQLISESLAALGRPEEARTVLAQLINSHKGKRSRELGQVFYSLYRVESKSGNLSDALEALSKAHDNQPQNGGIALELGQLAVDLDEQDVAQRAFRSVTLLKTDGNSGVSPQDRAIAYYHLGSIAYRQGDARRAKLMLEKSIAEDPSLQGARELLTQLG